MFPKSPWSTPAVFPVFEADTRRSSHVVRSPRAGPGDAPGAGDATASAWDRDTVLREGMERQGEPPISEALLCVRKKGQVNTTKFHNNDRTEYKNIKLINLFFSLLKSSFYIPLFLIYHCPVSTKSLFTMSTKSYYIKLLHKLKLYRQSAS